MNRKLWQGLGATAALLALVSCGRSQDSNPAGPPPPADAPADAPQNAATQNAAAPAPTAIDTAKPLNALGTDPFWALQIRPATLNFSTQANPMRRVGNPGPKLDGAKARWTTALPGGAPLKVTLEIKACTGLADRSYPFTAEVEAEGRTLKGCATYADDTAATP